MHGLVATLQWDPQIRGALIFLTGLLLLPGSVALLLSTNVGAKIGVLLAATGLAGWLFALSLIWIVYGTGMKGNPPVWRLKEIDAGALADHTALPVARDFPKGWTVLPPSGAASAQAASDAFLVAPTGAVSKQKFPAPFKTTQDYVYVGAFSRGGHDYIFRLGSWRFSFTLGHHKFYIKHQPRYVVMRVQASLPSVTLAGAAATLPAQDPTQPVINVVMIRDVGSLRGPNTLIAASSFLVFAVCCSFLHRRDKEIMRRRALAPAPA